MRCDAPEGAVPETLREKQQRQNAQTDGDAQEQESPVHSEIPQTVNIKFSTLGGMEFCVTDGGFLRNMDPTERSPAAKTRSFETSGAIGRLMENAPIQLGRNGGVNL